MRTKENWVDALIDFFANGDCPQEMKGKYHPEIIAFHLGVALDYLITKVLYPEASKTNNWGMLDVYVKTYLNVPILDDTDRDERYSDLPIQPVNLPSNRGVRFISTNKDQSYRFIYRDNNTENIFGGLDVDEVITTPRYYVEGKKVFYSHHLPYDLKFVLMKLIPPFDALDDDDDVNIPQGYGKLVFDLVAQSLSGRKLEKVSNDNNSNIP